jgi:hypothetical protein
MPSIPPLLTCLQSWPPLPSLQVAPQGVSTPPSLKKKLPLQREEHISRLCTSTKYPLLSCPESWLALPSFTAAPLRVLDTALASKHKSLPNPPLQLHRIFLIPELLVSILSVLPLEDLRNCYRVSSQWREIIHTHMPPKKIPLPGDVETYERPIAVPHGHVSMHPALSGLENQEWPASWQYNEVGQPTGGQISLELFYHEYLSLFDDESIYQDAYIAYPPPTSVQVHCHRTAVISFSDDNNWCHEDRLGWQYLQVERDDGVRLRDVLDYIRGAVRLCDDDPWEEYASRTQDFFSPKEYIAAWEYFGDHAGDMRDNNLSHPYALGWMYYYYERNHWGHQMPSEQTRRFGLELVFSWDPLSRRRNASLEEGASSEEDSDWLSDEFDW